MLVILDLDETLIHATGNPQDDFWDFQLKHYFVYKRPGLDEFLRELKKHFRVAVWSSASDYYVSQIVKEIFPEDYFLEFVWGRSKCTIRSNNLEIVEYNPYHSGNHYYYLKKLKKVKNEGFGLLHRTLIIDDSPEKSQHNYGNAIYPNPFLGNQNDNELPYLLKYLLLLKDEPNVREIEKRNWHQEVGFKDN